MTLELLMSTAATRTHAVQIVPFVVCACIPNHDAHTSVWLSPSAPIRCHVGQQEAVKTRTTARNQLVVATTPLSRSISIPDRNGCCLICFGHFWSCPRLRRCGPARPWPTWKHDLAFRPAYRSSLLGQSRDTDHQINRGIAEAIEGAKTALSRLF